LSSIPVIGFLFGAIKNTDTHSELYLFLTPHIVASDEDAARVRRGVEGRLDEKGAQRDENPPVIPVKPPVKP